MSALLLVLAALQDADDFERRIRPLLVERCGECHSAASKKLKGNLLLDAPAGIRKGGDLGPAVVAGDPDRSLLVRAVRWADEDGRMPPKKKLPAAEIALLEDWVRAGAPMPADRVPTAAPGAEKSHWAFQPVREPAAPAVKDRTWSRTSIDPFVLAALEAKGLRPSPPADPRTLLRRAAYDLTGLPPSPEEVEAFAADPSPEAWDRAVERLLASPRYGERWGRHWLDVARYADTKGYVYADRDEPRFIHAWAYRDWVVRAFNEDLPYDRFLQLQLATDRLASDPRDLAAMGFLTVGRRFINNLHDIIDDRIDTVGRGMMALTLACARCHDHKFDPVPTADYYSLYGVFASSTESQKPLAPPGDGPFGAELRKRQEALTSLFEKKRGELLARIRSQAALYFPAAAAAEKLPTEEFYQLLDANEVNPVFARRWRAVIDAARGSAHPVFEAWHALREIPERDLAAKAPAWISANRGRINARVAAALEPAPSSFAEVATRYGRVFADLDAQVKAKQELDPAGRELEALYYGPASPASFPPGAISEVEWFFDEKTRVELAKAQLNIERWILQSPDAPAYASVLEDRPEPHAPRVFRRGNPATKGPEVPRWFLGFLDPARAPFADGSGRLEIARKIASDGNPLTARVWVNRVWQQHFGRGLVTTPGDFGLRSDPPSHPELLDHLARRLVESGWSTKSLHRLILRSAAWRQAGDDVPAARAVDPENRLLWRQNRRRLEWEAVRDSLLLASGRLDPSIGGRPVGLDAPRRSLYLFIDRLNVPGAFRAFDAANADVSTSKRHETVVPQQALFLMNSPFLAAQAKALAGRAGADPVGGLYRLLFQRAPDPAERAAGERWLQRPSAKAPDWTPGPWHYGFGPVDAAGKAAFTPLPHFTGAAWQGGPSWPDAARGWVQLTAQGGHPGNDAAHAAIRRWIAPADLAVSISGKLVHEPAPGNGIRARILGPKGEIASWTLHKMSAPTAVEGVVVRKGESLDFVVDIAGDLNSDQFLWSPVIKSKDKTWDAAKDFSGPAPRPMTALERYAQTLLLSNEFMWVD